MERLTIPDVRVDEHTTRRSVIDVLAVQEHAPKPSGRCRKWRARRMAKRKNVMDITPVCERCGKVAPNWTVYRTKEPCECGGKYTARAFLEDKEADHA